MHRRLIGMKKSMFAVFERLFGRMVGSDVVFGDAVFARLRVM